VKQPREAHNDVLTSWPLEELDLQRLEELRANSASENQRLEFKRLMLSATESDKLELLKAASAFANTFGGDPVFGVEAPRGIPKSFEGVPVAEINQSKLRLRLPARRCNHDSPLYPSNRDAKSRIFLNIGRRGHPCPRATAEQY